MAAIVVALAILVPFIVVYEPFATEAPTGTSAVGGATLEQSGTSSAAETTALTETSAVGADAISRGEEIFNATCSVCHGPGGVGIEGLGKTLIGSDYTAGLTDPELLAFLVEGRASDDPLNTTGIAMPPRGGNVALTDSDLLDVIEYLRTL